MHYEHIKSLKDESFRRLVGTKKETFTFALKALQKQYAIDHAKGGRNPKLCLADQLLLTLKYYREYVTIFSLSQTYQIGESNANRIIHWVENTLSKVPEFQLPGKKALQESDMEFEVFIVDATESPIERPKRPRGKKESS